MSNKTSIQISKELKAKLDKLGNKGDTYEDIIKRLVEEHGKRKTKTARGDPP